MQLRTLEDVDPRRKTVLVRADLNVPLDEGAVSDDFRIRSALPTIRALREASAKVVVCTHLGRPKGRDESLSTRPVAEAMAALAQVDVHHVPDVAGPVAATAVHDAGPGDVLLLRMGRKRRAPPPCVHGRRPRLRLPRQKHRLSTAATTNRQSAPARDAESPQRRNNYGAMSPGHFLFFYIVSPLNPITPTT